MKRNAFLEAENTKLKKFKERAEQSYVLPDTLLEREIFKEIFQDDQIFYLKNNRRPPGNKWSMATIRRSLKYRYQCGTRGMYISTLELTYNFHIP